MDLKLTVLIVLATLGFLLDISSAEFFYDRPLPKAEELGIMKLKCIPGRTVMKVEEKIVEVEPVESDSEEFSHRRYSEIDAEERCFICVCSAEGKDEYCSKRNAASVNECMRISYAMSNRESAEPFDIEKSLAYRVRRDLMWHNDEIPYDPSSKCYRGHSYYSNHDTPNDTDIQHADSNLTSLLDYPSNTSCYYCVCSVSGDEAGCISRNIWFCNYLRYLRTDMAGRDMYAQTFQYDRPAYFRQLSWRMRRTMDDSLYNLIEHGGDTLCCNHPDGHRRQLHNGIHNKLRTLKRRVPKENLLGGAMRVTGGKVGRVNQRQLDSQDKCVPYVSQYSDCNEINQCSGCTKCLCSTDSSWECRSVRICNENDEDAVDDEMYEAAIEKLEFEMEKLKKEQQKYAPSLNVLFSEGKKKRRREDELRPAHVNTRLVPEPPGSKRQDTEDLLGQMRYNDPVDNMKRYLNRHKRASNKKNTEKKHNKRSTEKTKSKRQTRNSTNETVKFYSTVDELNEDTLKNSNISGTLPAKRMELKDLPNKSRRSNVIDKSNTSLHIDFNQPNHITDNKIDATEHDNKFDLSHEKLNMLLGNHTQKNKDTELSKLVVNELKPGSEIVGDVNAPVTSNVTFTLENDTLTAMAYIAGNLLNKLWTMEKDSTGSTLETEDMKHEKISDLLDLFKEPLNLKQEKFLKNVLERLSSAIDTEKDVKNVTICQTIEEATKLIHNYDNPDGEESLKAIVKEEKPCKKTSKDEDSKISQYDTAKAISKINTVLGLLKTFENIHSNLTNIKNESEFVNLTKPIKTKLVIDTILTKPEANSLNVYGNLLDKIVKVLLPKQDSEKIRNVIKQKNMFSDDLTFRNNYMKMFKTDLNNMTVTDKDKIILDYLTHISSKPDCLLNKINGNSNIKSLPTVEGNILLNLSEFFKIKSITDLMNLVEPTKAKTNINAPTSTTTTTTTTVTPVESSTVTIEKKTTKNLRTDIPKSFASTKDKLKAHLKSIIEDLIELQNAKGIHTRGNIKIADALPCIYNIMNAGKDILNKNDEEKNKPDNIADMLNELRFDMRRMQTRRSGSIMQVRPKSAVVLERVIKNLSEKPKAKTRRVINAKSTKPFVNVTNIIYKLRNISSTYKKRVIFDEVPAADRLGLLKTLQAEVNNYISALEGIKVEFNNLNKLPFDQFSMLATFILNSAANISLDEKILAKMEVLPHRNNFLDEMNTSNFIQRTVTERNKLNSYDYNNDMTISRQQIIDHLIKKRVETYMKLKEAKEYDVEHNMNYNIAKRVLFYLNIGNINLAHELFKVLVSKKDDPGIPLSISDTSNFAIPAVKRIDNPISFEEPKILDNEAKYLSQDHLIKQLLNIKNMGV